MTVNDDLLTEAVKVYKVLANVHRIKILTFLENNQADVTTIVAHLQIAQPIVSHQLAILHDYQLVSKRREGKHIYYCLDDPHILKVIDATLGHVQHEITGQPHPKNQKD
ncbi:ArsR/SmtB family transcription factor [Lapidilactobacillus wuchangensis]|uniref:ArsR/SmtB family transcription factor n=1 Tax=Lapidilactobacillus wuchangensis TaxID=2486001 RepID=UPI000F78E6D1|nr:metalloregulator ArsR/SmtB family transcription factor [Lapidilactobacillus wuchangensis]